MKEKAILSLTAVLTMLLVVSCTPRPAQIKAAPPEETEIKDMTVTDFPERTQIVIHSEQPVVYTTFQLTDPLRLVVDLAGMTPGRFTESIPVQSGAVLNILPKVAELPRRAVSLEIGLASLVESKVRTEGTDLIIDISKTTEEQKSAPSEETVTAPPLVPEKEISLQEEVKTPVLATVIKKVEVNKKDGLRVIIVADGALSPDVFSPDPQRLVIDLPGTENKTKSPRISIGHRLLRGIRIGQHLDPKKVRVVLDVPRPVSYDLNKENDRLIVSLKEIPSQPPQQQKVEKPAVPEVKAPEKGMPPVEKVTPPAEKGTPPAEGGEKQYTGRKISLDFQDADITNVLRLIADVGGFNLVLGDDVKGKVTLKLNNVPWDQALDIVLKLHNLGQVREGAIIRVATVSNITRQQDEEARAKDARIKAQDLVTKVVILNYAEAKKLTDPLKKSLSPRGDVTVDERTNSLIIRDVGEKIEAVADLVKTLDTKTPQVSIESRIVQMSPEFTRSLGIQWGATTTAISGNNLFGIQGINLGGGGTPPAFGVTSPDFSVNLPAAPALGALGFAFGRFTGNPINLDLRLSAGEIRGLTKIISSPKVTVLNNQDAKIEQGESIPFATVSQAGTQTTFVDANLSLVVTPHVTADGSILMKIKAAKNAPGTTRPGASGPSILKKEATTTVLVKDGETTVIGGIYETSRTEITSGVPWLYKIPILGWLFKKKDVNETTSELLVFVTPRIVE